MATLADILVTLTLDTTEFNRSLQEVSRNLQNMSGTVQQSAQQMTQQVQQSSQHMANNMNNVSNSSRTLARTLGTSLRDSRRVLVAGTQEFRNFGGAGQRVSQAIRQEFSALPRHLQLYAQRLRQAGESTDSFARLNVMYGQRMIQSMRESNDYLQQRTTQSTRLMRSFAENTNLAPLTNGFLRLGHRMEDTARQGSVLNIALSRIGPNASLRDLQDQMRFVQQGIMRARGAFLVFGIASGLAVFGMIKLANAVDKRVAPAFENMKKNLLDAFMPFITTFATGMVAVMNFVSGIAKMVDKFSEANPVIFSMIMSIIMLTLVLGALLAPLAVTGIATEGLAASFGALWMMISPFVLGVLAVIGVALALATAIVVLWVSIKKLWDNSEAFRKAFTTLWNGIKTAIINGVVNPVIQAWNTLKTAFSNLIAQFTGGAGTMNNLWKFLGDHIAVVVTFISGAILPILQNAFQILGTVLVAVINGIIVVVNWMAEMWKQHGTEITTVASQIWTVVSFAFSQIASFIMSKMPQIKAIISDGFNAIKAVVGFVMKYIAPIVVGAFKVIWAIIQFVMPFIVSLIISTWNNIKAVITSTINIIQNVIQLFTNILKGNWSGAWENVKAILKNAVILIWNLVQLYFIGKLLSPLKIFGSSAKAIMKGAWNGIKTIVTSVMNGLRSFLVGVWNAIKSSLSGSFTGIRNLAVNTFNGLKSAVMGIFNALKGTVSSVWNGIKTAITNPIEKAKSVVLGIIKAIVRAFAGMAIHIPKPHIPKVSIGWTTIGKGKASVKIPKISWNAKGGIFNGASLLGGGQGVGEAGAEAVMPVQHKRYMKPFASAVAGHLQAMTKGNSQQSSGTKYEIHFDQPVIIREDADIQRIVDELERRKKISERAKGVFSY